MPSPLVDRLISLIGKQAPPAGSAWLNAQLAAAAVRSPAALSDFLLAFSAMSRRVGTHPLAKVGDGGGPGGEAVPPSLVGRGLDEVGRVALLLARLDATGTEPLALAQELFYHGDSREKQAVLRALPLLPQPAQFVEIGIEACRSSVQTVYEAIACENPYPADHFSDEAFNQMVLKALFTEASVARIHGLARRAGKDLVRMVEFYGDERRVAGRKVPEDIDRIRALVRSQP